MKWRCLFFLFTCLLMHELVSSQVIFNKKENRMTFTCNGEWEMKNYSRQTELSLGYEDENTEYKCMVTDSDEPITKLMVRIRTCDNCIELDKPGLTAIILGNILATFLIGCAVYSITGQNKGKNFSGNKASDKVNLISNGEGDTYQRLTPGQASEYSGLSGIRKK